MSGLLFVALCSWIGMVLGGVPCRQDWDHFGDSCYAFGESKVSWADAQDICRAAGGKLAEIETSPENEFLKSQLLQRHAHDTGLFWIGGTDIFHEGVWTWISTGELISFSDWGTGDPSDSGGNEDCMCMWFDRTAYRWGDCPCTAIHYFVCEGPVDEDVVVG